MKKNAKTNAPPALWREVSDADSASFKRTRTRLFGIAYRVLGDKAEADEVVQETWIRWQRTDRSRVRDPAAFLATTTTRLAINVRQCARARHETCICPRLPEPADTGTDPALRAERDGELELAVHMLLEKLSATERAAYVLREAFDYPYTHISQVLALTEANARQLVSRARVHLADGPRRRVGAPEERRFLEAFVGAARAGDFLPLERLLAADVVQLSDGGGGIDSPSVASLRRARAMSARADIAA